MAVLFDLDGTIVGAHREKYEVRKECAEKAGLPIIKNEEYYEALRKVLHNKKVTDRVPVFKEIFGDKNQAKKMAAEYRKKSLENAYLYPDAEEVLKKIKLKKGLITNGPRDVQWEKIKKFDLGKYFDSIAVSGEVGKSKPEKEIFYHVLNSLEATPEESLYVGNVPELDVAGAKNAGLTSVLLDREDCLSDQRADYEINDLRELYDILEGFKGY